MNHFTGICCKFFLTRSLKRYPGQERGAECRVGGGQNEPHSLHRLKVARAARGQATRILNLILLHQPPPKRLLITWELPLYIKDLLAGSDEFFGMAMTRETPLHC